VMSIPRDTMVNVNWDVKKINSVYNVGGMDMLKEEVASLIGFEPDFTVDINLEAFGKLVDAIGGVDFDIPYNMNYDDPVQDLHIHFTAGSQHLDGDDAMRVVRFRKNNDGTHSDGDVGRIKLQQSFMTALLKQCLTIQNVTKISDFAKIFNEDVTTELSVDNIIYFGKAIISGGMNSSNVNFFTMPYTSGSVWSRTQGSYLSYVFPTSDDLIDDVNSDMNPYQKQVTLKNLDLMGVSSNGKITSSSGVIEDSKANSSTPSKTSASTKAATDDDVEIPAPAKTTTSTKTAATASTKATSAGETTTKGTPAEATTTATKATAADDTTTKTTPAADAANAAADTANSPDD
jgi:LCP family protein required for cell wall assembly